jgi:hypothetical protein
MDLHGLLLLVTVIIAAEEEPEVLWMSGSSAT